MSLEAINWVLNFAPDMPPHLFALMMGLANHADPFGEGARPSQDTLAWYTRKSDRQVRNDLDAAKALGLIRHGDQRLVDHLPADRRPIVYDLAIEMVRDQRPKKSKSDAKSCGDDAMSAGSVVPPVNQESGNDRKCTSPPGGSTVPVAGGSPLPTNRPYEPSVEPSTPYAREAEPTAPKNPSPGADQPTQVREDRPPNVGVEAVTGGGGNPNEKTPMDPGIRIMLGKARDQACASQPGWSPDQVTATMVDAMDAGRTADAVAAAIVALAAGKHGVTGSPKRMLADGPWWGAEPVHRCAPADGRELCLRHHKRHVGGCPLCKEEWADAEADRMSADAAKRAVRAVLAGKGAAPLRRQEKPAMAPSGGRTGPVVGGFGFCLVCAADGQHTIATDPTAGDRCAYHADAPRPVEVEAQTEDGGGAFSA